ncbi:maleylpyruvate isomerase [Lentzea aerocolonigenes]|uniref:Maleylpyruvate isomerase n=1 Tax=Lentzea aerocolonigenes TaxID=68170 RepID=A0A0F0GKF4_LENAE|nr:DinB family protein [Lentzea aerocolonigenes]KJK41903.1 maleylpyruvate isomerase [Lentzea aerocolonigenes]
MDTTSLHDELERARATFHELLAHATAAELRRRSNGTKWNNRQLLFHMLLGFLIMRALTAMACGFSRMPPGVSRVFARVLNAATRPFDVANFLGSWLGGTFLSLHLMNVLCDRTIAALHRRLDREPDLARGMHYPTRWDPFFQDFMTLADLYRFPVRHFDFHRRQLSC